MIRAPGKPCVEGLAKGRRLRSIGAAVAATMEAVSAKDMVSQTARRTARTVAWRVAVGSVLAAATLVTSGVAQAADPIATVELTKAGPKTPVPLREKFYLQGEAPKDVRSVHVVFVRYRYAPWGLAPRKEGRMRPSSCSEVKAAIVDRDPSTDVLERGGVVRFGDLWPSPEDQTAGKEAHTASEEVADDRAERHYRALSRYQERVYITPPWVASDYTGKDAQTWKTLVSNQEFFRPGARYCLFVISQAAKTLDDATIDELFVGFEAEARACEDDEKCLQKAHRALLARVDALDFDAAAKAKVRKSLEDHSGSIIDIVTTGNDVRSLLGRWQQLQRAFSVNEGRLGPGGPAPTELSGTIITLRVGGNAAEEALSTLLLNTLLLRTEVTFDGRRYVAYSGKKRLEVGSVAIVFDEAGVSKALRMTGKSLDGGAEETFQYDLDLDDLKVPVANGVLTFEDLLQFLGGRIRLGRGSYVAFDQVLVRHKDLLTDWKPNTTRTALKTAASNLLDTMRALRAAELAEQTAAAAGPASPGTPPHVVELHRLFEALDPFVQCSAIPTSPADPDLSCGPPKGTVDWWPGYTSNNATTDSQNALYLLRERLFSIEDAVPSIEQARAALKTELATTKKEAVLQPIELEVDLTQQAFFDTYVTPVVGVALLPRHPDTITTNAGLQVFLWPNPIHEPMWSNGRLDVRRLVGAELSLRTSGQAYGPANRFGPLPGSGIPPFFAGGVLQFLPYTTFGSGVAVFGYRRSVLPDERERTRVGWYISINVQFNIAGAIRKLADGERPAILTGG